MSLPDAWVESLFARLTIRYGAAFMRQYADLDANAVKADWADVLGGFVNNPAAIKYGLDHLPTDRPINAMQFRAVCNSMPAERVLAITRDTPIASNVAEIVAKIKPAEARDMKQWARDLQSREQGGEKLSQAQRDAWRLALTEAA